MIVHYDTSWWRAKRSPSAAAAAAGNGLAFWALVAFTFVLLLAPQAHIAVLAPLRIALLSAGAAVLAHLFNRLSRGLPVVEFNPAVVGVLLLVGWAVVTIPFSLWPGGSVAFLLETFLKTVLVFLLLAHVVDSRGRLYLLCGALVLFSLPLALITVAQFVSGDLVAGSQRVAGYEAALTSNPNDMALWLNLVLPLCLALLLDARTLRLRLLLAAVACVMVVAIIATFSRAGFVTLALIAVCYAWALRKRPQRVWLPVLLLLAVIAWPLVPDSYVARMDTIVNIEDDDSGSAQTRLADSKVAARLALARPVLGSGIGTNVLAMNEARGETWIEIHNVYLQYAVELGVPGLALFLLVYLRCLRATGAVVRGRDGASTRGRLFHLAEGLRVSLLAFAVAGLFHPVAYQFYFYYIAGLAIAAERLYGAGEREAHA